MLWNWALNRATVDRLKWFRGFSASSRKKILFLTIKNDISEAQIFPLFLYARQLADQHGIEVRELPLHAFLADPNPYDLHPDVVCFQTWFDLTAEQLTSLLEKIGSAWPAAKVAYFDWFAPTDLRYAETLTPLVSAYVKKQVLADPDAYRIPTVGDTNLTDYYAKRFGLNLPQTHFAVPDGFWRKFVLGSGFELSPRIMRLLKREPAFEDRPFDLHARFAANGSEWYEHMRREAKQKTAGLATKYVVAHEGSVPPRRFTAELRRSRFCLSPFGYGEVCWRDFEAMATGSVLLKPDMSHLRLAHPFFRPFETYVPLAWNLSDLDEKLAHYLRAPDEARAIARNAFDMLRAIYKNEQFLRDSEALWPLVGID
ncbi:MAG: glycosyltransferase [Hyphomicrobium sp.]|uniref:glycosyltransferase family protein n=1 Tax=Hyphomicrobium sp. TaxID=82 RepID=UPI0039E56DF9